VILLEFPYRSLEDLVGFGWKGCVAANFQDLLAPVCNDNWFARSLDVTEITQSFRFDLSFRDSDHSFRPPIEIGF